MTPKITRQTKILIKDKHADGSSRNIAKFTAMDPVPTVSLYLKANLYNALETHISIICSERIGRMGRKHRRLGSRRYK